MIDVLPKLLLELRQDGAVSAIVSTRVAGDEPKEGWAQGPGSYRAFVVLTNLVTPRHPQVPTQAARISARCYGRTAVEASSLYGACSDAIHAVGPRVFSNGLGIYVTHDDTGGNPGKDPDTKQPYVSFVIEAIATTQVVA